jgi:glycogen(starch) synthase
MNEGTILHVLDHALPELSGYSIRSHHVLRALRRGGLPVVAIAPAADLATPDRCIDDVPYVTLPRCRPAAASVPRMLALFTALRRQVQARRVALVHAHTPVRTGLPAYLAARTVGVPIVYEMHGLWEDSAVDRRRLRPHSLRYRTGRGLETWLMRRVDSLAVLSHGLVEDARHRGVARRRIVHVPNGVDCARFRPLPRDTALAARHGLTDAFVIGFVGSFFAYEGVDVLVRAFAALRPELPHARLLLVGDGDTGEAVRALVTRLRLDDAVAFAGRVPHAQVPSYYALCDVLAYPRRPSRMTELVTPLRPLEAMAMGRAIIASDVGGLREILRDGETGVLVRGGDAAALAGGLRRLACDAERRRRLGERARAVATAERDWGSLAAVYAAAYEQARAAHAARRAGRR